QESGRTEDHGFLSVARLTLSRRRRMLGAARRLGGEAVVPFGSHSGKGASNLRLAALELATQREPNQQGSQRDHDDRPEAYRDKLIWAVRVLPFAGCGRVPVRLVAIS